MSTTWISQLLLWFQMQWLVLQASLSISIIAFKERLHKLMCITICVLYCVITVLNCVIYDTQLFIGHIHAAYWQARHLVICEVASLLTIYFLLPSAEDESQPHAIACHWQVYTHIDQRTSPLHVDMGGVANRKPHPKQTCYEVGISPLWLYRFGIISMWQTLFLQKSYILYDIMYWKHKNSKKQTAVRITSK